jgi:nucleotide-binding universal stress UspA family protein
MPIRDVFLPLVGEPSAAALTAVECCVAAAAGLGARITAYAVEEDIHTRPKVMISPDVENAEWSRAVNSVTAAQDLLNAFRKAASRLGLRSDSLLRRLPSDEVAGAVAEHARYKDFTILPVRANDSRSEHLIETLIFESGRPLLLCPEAHAESLRPEFANVMIGWDRSARAARAIGEAMPILQEAKSVRVITATDDSSAEVAQSGAGIVDHLREHGVFASFETVAVAGSSTGKVLGSWARTHEIDLMVMGAYQHSRFNEILWGGVTKTVIGEPPCWVMMSH